MAVQDNGRETDRSGVPSLGSIYLNPTKYCNLACKHCWVSPPYSEKLSGESGELTIDEMIAIVKEARGLGMGGLKLTGGEPLLREGIERLLGFCSATGVTVWIETNGTLVTEKMAEAFVKYDVRDISVSLDSHIEERNDHLRGRKGAFRKAVCGIKNLVAAGMAPEVIISFYRENMEDFGTFLGYMAELGVRMVKINVISPVGRGAVLMKSGVVPSVKETLDFYREMRSRYTSFSGDIVMDIPMAFKDLDEIKGNRCGTCALRNILGVLSDGSVSICGIGFVDESMLFGNIRKDPSLIKGIWETNPILKQIREEVPAKLEGVCGECVFRNACLGDCRAEVYHNTGSFTAPYWFCQEAYDAGLFPSTRLVPKERRR